MPLLLGTYQPVAGKNIFSNKEIENSKPCKEVTIQLQKGGDPAAPSGTATLLRLSPSYQFYPKSLLERLRSSGLPDFHGLTGGVYKARERIHRVIADTRLLAIPAS